ncbi:polysaccharide deacetylase family protein [uncultured Legionella sp.]|uniref:polysaccharide deacetylase family protein n=1 Tax=uncultured Legionella sp. TaxID=210934 RepID=UPI00263639D9|nr:polysaccharide deacetylase family protein [uncultured Legionella sp.]
MIRLGFITALLCSFVISSCFAGNKQIAITIDDLPFRSGEEHFYKIRDVLLKHKAPAIGFVVAEWVNDNTIPQLNALKADGFLIGSHSYSHRSLREIPADEYIEDIAKADSILAPYMTSPKYYRYPYLAEGRWWWVRNKVYDYLREHDYVKAPVTIDSRDFLFDVASTESESKIAEIKKNYIDFVWSKTQKTESSGKKQILLIHANLLNSYSLDDLLTMFESHGYEFISLPEALK